MNLDGAQKLSKNDLKAIHGGGNCLTLSQCLAGCTTGCASTTGHSTGPSGWETCYHCVNDSSNEN